MRDRDQKILLLNELAKTVARLRADGKRVVHCHGVFDLLHIGHIRHFNLAAKMGDVLVVTVTPDRFVNKGPHRPAFAEGNRAEAVAALDCVDLVAVNEWPTAVETIRTVKPDLFVKGSEYRDAEKDLTGAIAKEREAVEAVGGRLEFTDEVVFSSSNLLNEYMSVLPEDAREFLRDLAARHTVDQILEFLDRVRPLNVLVVGEAIIDEYQYCEAIGKSSKAPTLVVKAEDNERFAGGILAVANSIASFCDNVTLITQLGAYNSHELFVRQQLRSNIRPILLYRKDSPTILKRRYVESYFFAKLFEVYEINDGLSDPQDNVALCEQLDKHVGDFDLVVAVDFGHNLITAEAVEILCNKSKFLAVNTQANAGSRGYHRISKYPRADYLCVAENEVRMEAGDMQGDLQQIVRQVYRQSQFDRIVTTCGSHGALCCTADADMARVPALATKVVDRIGAGDAFLAVTAPCVAAGTPMEVVGFLGNVAGAEAVAGVGHRESIDRVKMARHIQVLFR